MINTTQIFQDFWQNLPKLFKLSVVEHLDYKSRCCLRKCSKIDRDFVDLIPIVLEHVKIKLGHNKTAQIVFNDNNDDDNVKFYPTEDIIRDFSSIFENPRSKVNQVEINGFTRGHDPLTLEVFEGLLAKIMEKNVKMNTKKFNFIIEFFNYEDLFVDLVKTTNPKILKSISIFHGITRRCLESLKDTEQWRNLKKVGFGDIESVNVDWLMHLEKIRFNVKEISAKDVWKMIQNFLSKNVPIQSYIDIKRNQEQDVNEFLDYFSKQDVVLKNEPISARDSQLYIHTQKFKFPSEDKVLLLKLNVWRIYVFVGRASRYE